MEKEIGRDVKARMIGTKEVCSSILNWTLCNNWRISSVVHRAFDNFVVLFVVFK